MKLLTWASVRRLAAALAEPAMPADAAALRKPPFPFHLTIPVAGQEPGLLLQEFLP